MIKLLYTYNKPMRRQLVYYLLILALPLSTGLYIYQQAFKQSESETKLYNEAILNEVRDIMDTRWREIDGIASQLAFNPRLNSVLNITDFSESRSDFYRVYDFVNNLPRYKLTNKWITEVFVFFRKTNITVSSGSAVYNYEQYYNEWFQYGNLAPEQWQQMLWGTRHNREFKPELSVSINREKLMVVPYLQTVPFETTNNDACLLILVNLNEIHNLLKRVNIGDSGIVFIRDKDGQVITSYQGTKSIVKPAEMTEAVLQRGSFKTAHGESMIVMETKSTSDDWSYVAVMPENIVLSKVQFIKKTTWIITIFSVLLAMLMAFVFSYRNTRQIRSFLHRMASTFQTDRNPSQNEYEDIEHAAVQLIRANQELQMKVKEQQPLMEAAFLRRLFYGEQVEVGELEKFLPDLAAVPSPPYVTMMIRVDSYSDIPVTGMEEERNASRILIKQHLKKKLDQTCLFYDINDELLAVFITLPGTDKQQIKPDLDEQIRQWSETWSGQYGIKPFFGLSGIHTDIEHSVVSFQQADQAVNFMKYDKDRTMMWYDEITGAHSDQFYFPLEIEFRLIRLLKAGSVEETKKVLVSLYEENMKQRDLSLETKRKWLEAMKGALLREADRLEAPAGVLEDLDEIDNASNIEEMFYALRHAYVRAATAVSDEEQKFKQAIHKDYLVFLEQNYSNSELNLSMMSERFRVSESYLYHYFKDNIGKSFAVYLEELRLNKSCELLAGNVVAVKDIAATVGYNSDSSFRRAFKRFIGVTPTEYKQLQAEKG